MANYMPPLDTLWHDAAHASTRGHGRTDEPADTLARLAARGTHLPARSPSAEAARRLRCLHGYPPLFSTADADQLSDLEESMEVGKDQSVRFGDKYIVQIGRRRTLYEEDLSQEEDEGRRGHTAPAEGEDPEGSPGRFVGGHTGHAQAEMVRAQQEAMQRAAAAEAAAISAAQRQAAVREEEQAADLDANVEDLDEDVEDLD